MPAERCTAVEDAKTVLTFTLGDGHKLALRAMTITSVADITPQVDEKGNSIGPTMIFTSGSRWNVKETVDDVLSVWCPEKDRG